MQTTSPRGLAVAQLGARRHYAVPRILHAAGLLERLYVDACASKGWPTLLHGVPRALRPAPLGRLLERVPQGIPNTSITAFNAFGLAYARRVARASGAAERSATQLWAARRFCRNVIEKLGDRDATPVYGFHLGALELLQHARAHGTHAVYDQTIAPHPVSHRILAEERERHPSWVASDEAGRPDAAARDREAAEWEAATLILCGSEFVREGVVASGGPAARCVVVAYGTDSGFAAAERPRPHGGKLRVLCVGEVSLRKGAPYVLDAARLLGARAEFRMVGNVTATTGAVQQLSQHVELLGAQPRSSMLDHYSWADVLLLPSLCEGSAGATYEALVAGVPVVTTQNTGSLIQDGEDGFLVPVRDAEAIAERLTQMADATELLAEMSRAAVARRSDFTLEGYRDRLLSVLRQHLERAP